VCVRCFRLVVFRRPGLRIGIKWMIGGTGGQREEGGGRILEELTGGVGME